MVALFVLLFVIALLAIDLVIQARSKSYPIMAAAPTGTNHVQGRETLRIPKSVFFHPGHTWARLQDGDSLEVGVDDFVQKALGGIDRIALPAVGQFVRQGEPVISVGHGGRQLTLVAPASGYVRSVNHDAVENPGMVTENPYRDGWLMMIEPAELARNLAVLHVAESAVTWIKEEVKRFREFLSASVAQPAVVGESMLDGGVPMTGVLKQLDEQHVHDFEQQFLR
jgi:glycine cleavage system H protein